MIPSKDILPSVGDEIHWISGFAQGQIAKVTVVNKPNVRLACVKQRDRGGSPRPGDAWDANWNYLVDGNVRAGVSAVDWIPGSASLLAPKPSSETFEPCDPNAPPNVGNILECRTMFAGQRWQVDKIEVVRSAIHDDVYVWCTLLRAPNDQSTSPLKVGAQLDIIWNVFGIQSDVTVWGLHYVIPNAPEPAWLMMPNGAQALPCDTCRIPFTHVGPNQKDGLTYRCPSCR